MHDKQCRGACKRYLPLAAFHKKRSSPDGHQQWCKACMLAAASTPERLEKNRIRNAIKTLDPVWRATKNAALIRRRQDDPDYRRKHNELCNKSQARLRVQRRCLRSLALDLQTLLQDDASPLAQVIRQRMAGVDLD